ncbi:acetyltransferase (gnat) family protein [Halogeometricum pallidum JCM 14848]|uniref:Acetyltransferase (Gnat) family protein n=1 Tax=Halogeometricum pallidum JCM 14848 TaxID=1227487 RepID=M0D687_HALPD|nr:GNAT family N-acetyltransferase [Halogeometricum pallidum]ELZ30373.1 acetyltransferase (gnat) family protein [Halogeometricum pallidum JCM 14848]
MTQPAPEVRSARPADCDAAVELLDAAMLEVDPAEVRERIEEGETLVADAGTRLVGVCVLESQADGAEITQIAVHRSRRARGLGRELVEAAAARTDGPLTATFRAQVRPFYEATGFEIEPADEGENKGGRFRGRFR